MKSNASAVTPLASGTTAARVRKGVVAVALGIVGIISILPFVMMLSTALQDAPRPQLWLNPADINFDHFKSVFVSHGFGKALLTSIIVVTIACSVNVVVCSFAAYAFEKKRFTGSEWVFWIYLATMMIPPQVTLIPLYTIMRDLGLLNTHLALALPVINAFGVILIRQFMKNVPDELMEAARIDGAGDFKIFYRIVVPLIRPVIIALVVFTFLTTWNDFLWPLVSITTNEMETVTLAAANLQGRFSTNWGLVMSGATIAFAVPLIAYVTLQKYFVEGLVAGSVKG